MVGLGAALLSAHPPDWSWTRRSRPIRAGAGQCALPGVCRGAGAFRAARGAGAALDVANAGRMRRLDRRIVADPVRLRAQPVRLSARRRRRTDRAVRHAARRTAVVADPVAGAAAAGGRMAGEAPAGQHRRGLCAAAGRGVHHGADRPADADAADGVRPAGGRAAANPVAPGGGHGAGCRDIVPGGIAGDLAADLLPPGGEVLRPDGAFRQQRLRPGLCPGLRDGPAEPLDRRRLRWLPAFLRQSGLFPPDLRRRHRQWRRGGDLLPAPA